jgi:subtilisin family serine protease
MDPTITLVLSCTFLERAMVFRGDSSVRDVMETDREVESGPDIRDLIRAFTPELNDSRLLRWDPTLDNEDGFGIQVALFDSGIFRKHPALQGARIKARDFTGSDGVYDSTGHGTKNAGLLVAQGHGWLRGIAPACTLLVGKVLGTGGLDASAKALARAIRWAVYKGVHIVILPLGRAHGSPLVTHEVHRALGRGCVFFASAGNRGPDTLLFPASIRGVTAVSAAGPDGTPLEWCCQTSQVDFYAPGLDVWSIGSKNRCTVSGSSPATVLTAGLFALRLAQEQRIRQKLGGQND